MESNFNPIMHQDLINSNIGMIPQIGTGIYNTNMLSGVHLQPQPDNDKFVLMKQKDKEERNAFLISLAALGVIATSAALLFKGKINFKGFGNSIASLFKGLGGKTKNIVNTSSTKIHSADSWLKKAGRWIVAPFKWIGKTVVRGAQAAGRMISAPFKWIGNKFHKKT